MAASSDMIAVICRLVSASACPAAWLASIRACPRQPGVDEIKIPGQPEHETCERRLAEGLELPEAVEQELRQLAAHYQVEYMTKSPAGGGPQSGASHRTCRA